MKKQKIVEARITEKTTADLYYYLHIGFYTGCYESTYLSFTGTNAEKLQEDLNTFMKGKTEEVKESWEKAQSIKIKEIQDKLSTVVDGFFSKPSKQIKKELQEEMNKKWNGISEMYKNMLYFEFLGKYKAVKISKSEHSTIYEILPF